MPKTADTLKAKEKDRLVEAVRDLIDTLGWTPTQLARHLGYRSPRMIHKVRKAEGAMARPNYEEVLRLIDNCTLPEEASAKARDEGERKPHPWAQNAREILAELRGRGVSVRAVAEAVGYTSASTLSHALRHGYLPEERYHRLVRFMEQVRSEANEPTSVPLEPEPRPTATVGTRVASRQNGAVAVREVRNRSGEHRRADAAIPIYTVLQQAHDQLASAVRTLDRGAEVANVLVAPGVKMFRARVAEIQKSLEQVIVMQ